jgi:selenocysteine lyase/cysteine desulfurase
MSTIDDYIASFSEEPGYLDFARFGPLGEAALAEERGHLEIMSRARFGSLPTPHGEDERVEAAVASLIGFRTDQIVFQPATSQALMHVMFGLTGGIAASPDDFPAVGYSIARAAEALGVLVPHTITPEHSRVTPGVVRDQMANSVVAVVVSLVDYRTGHLVDLEGIRQVIGDRLLIVDAVQGAGVVEAPWSVADVVISGGETWLRAGHGTGFLALSDRAREQLTPVWSGWNAIDDDLTDGPRHDILEPAPTAHAFRVGVADALAQARLAGSIEQAVAVGIPLIRERILDRASAIIAAADEVGLTVTSPRGDSERAGIVVVEPSESELSILTAAFHNHGITAAVRAGRVRLSPHASTSDESMDLLRAALGEYQATAQL